MNSTIVAPFEKKDVQEMKTTNNIEKCVMKKLFEGKVKGSEGLILDEATNNIKVRPNSRLNLS